MLVTEMLSSYLTKDDFPRPALATITRLTQENFNTEDGGTETKWAMHFEEYDRALILNKTNIRLAAAFLGNDTSAWMGRKIVIHNDPTVSFGGRTVGGLRLRAPKNQGTTPPAAQRHPQPSGFEDFEDDIPFEIQP